MVGAAVVVVEYCSSTWDVAMLRTHGHGVDLGCSITSGGSMREKAMPVFKTAGGTGAQFRGVRRDIEALILVAGGWKWP